MIVSKWRDCRFKQYILDIYLEEYNMEEHFFNTDTQIEHGDLLYESLWKANEAAEPATVVIYQKLIKYQQKILPFAFELRFMVTDKQISFYLQEHEITFSLPNEDSKQWRSILKKFINQVGFHQQFKPIKKIGKGNFASVYLVERIEDHSKCAVKAFSKEAAYSEENGKECLMKEVDIMRHLNNRHNMKLTEVFQSDNSLYLIFQLLEGGHLFEKIKAKQKFKPHQIKNMVQGLLQGLREMHSQNIMHRDLKPQNILFKNTSSSDCVIGDYGLAQFSDADSYLFVRCGTPGYVAPEVINIKDMKTKYSCACDIFSLGLIFHLLLFGKSVFKGKTYNEVLNENRSCNFTLEGEEYEKIDPIILDLLKKMLKINPQERINAEAALGHPYFKEELQLKQEQLQMQKMDKVTFVGDSPILTTGNQFRRQAKNLKKDSCIDFKMAKDPLITGNTETVGTLGSAKTSGFGIGLLKGLKASKFVKPDLVKEQKQN